MKKLLSFGLGLTLLAGQGVVLAAEAVAPAKFSQISVHAQALVEAEQAGNLGSVKSQFEQLQVVLGNQDGVEQSTANLVDVEAALSGLGFVEYAINTNSPLKAKDDFLKAVLVVYSNQLGNSSTTAADLAQVRATLKSFAADLATFEGNVQQAVLNLVAALATATPKSKSWVNAKTISATVAVLALVTALGAKKIK